MFSASSRRRVLLVAVSGLTVLGAGVAVAAPMATHESTLVLRGDVLPGLTGLTPLQPTGPARSIQVDVTIARPDPAGEAAAERAVYTPGSPQFHHFFTPASFAARFGVPQQQYDAVRGWATAGGLHVVRSSSSRDLIVLRGSVRQVERTFSVQLADYRADGTTFYANTAAPAVPAGLGISGVIGLTDKLRSHTFHSAPPPTAPHGVTPAQDTCDAGPCVGLTTPQDLWSIYDQPTDNYGEGQRMAVFGEGQTDPVISNLRSFESLHHLPQVPITVKRTDTATGANYDDNTGEVEWDMDTQASTGVAPDVQSETLYFGTDLSDQSVLNVFNTWASDPDGPLQASASYGECEANPVGDAVPAPATYSAGEMFTQGAEATLTQAVLEGRTLFASSGDTGSTCPVVPVNVNGVGYELPGVNYPASSPHVVAVGGTVLYAQPGPNTTDLSRPSGAARTLEYAWTYTGGGSSVTFDKPAFQDGISAIDGVCLDGNPCRGVPDVAAQSGDVATNGYAIVAGGETNYPGGGTSLSSPLTMGMWTRVQAAAPGLTTTTTVPCPTATPTGSEQSPSADSRAKGQGNGHGNGNGNGNGHGSAQGGGGSTCTPTTTSTTTYPGLGFADPVFYADSAKHPGDFFDIGDPANGETVPTANGTNVSLPGWDYLSGLGVPDVTQVATHAAGGTQPANPLPAPCPYGDASCTTGGGTTGGTAVCGQALFTDPAGDDAYVGDPNGSGSNPQLDLLAGRLYDDGTTLHASLTLDDLSTAMAQAAGGANEYYLLWNYNGTQYFANAEVGPDGSITYGDGSVSGQQFVTNNSGDHGTFAPGKDGTIVIDVPLAHVGSPAAGAVLAAPAAQTRVLVGTTATGGLIEQADVANPHSDYTMGSCSS